MDKITCGNCGSNEIDHLHSPDDYIYWCNNCGAISTHKTAVIWDVPKISMLSDQYLDEYEENMARASSEAVERDLDNS